MNGIVKLIVALILFAVPAICRCETFAYSPSITGQPLIFHFNTSRLQPFQISAVTWTQFQNTLLIRSSCSHLRAE